MGLTHVSSFARLCGRDVEIAAVTSSNPTHIKMAAAIAPAARVCQSELELIRSPLDAVVISTPNFIHVRLALETLRSGKHLFLEKPCGINRAECRELLNAAQRTDRIVMIGHELRYSPYFQKIKRLIDRGAIGTPRLVWCREFRGPFQKKSRDWIEDPTRSGGTLVDKNCHHFDLMNWWAGARPKRVAAFGGCAVNFQTSEKKSPRRVHDHATVVFEYENGVRGTHQLCLFALDFPEEDLEMGIAGDRGFLQTRLSRLEILQWNRGRKMPQPIVHQVAAQAGQGWGHHLGLDEIHRAFVSAIRKNKPPLTTVRECLDGTLLAIAAEESIKKGKVIAV